MAQSPEILNDVSMKVRYGSFHSRGNNVQLDPESVPSSVLPLLNYAKFWGIADDRAHHDLLSNAPPDIRQNLKDVVAWFNDDLDKWLSGREADVSHPSEEYIAYSAMRMAAYQA